MTTTARRRRLAKGILGLSSMAIALVAWAFASPVGASPDEDYHLTSIWCGHGARDGLCEPAVQADERQALESLLTSPCYVFRSDASAACQVATLEDNDNLVVTDRGNFDGTYPPLFYFFMSFFVGEGVVPSVIAMRLVNILVALTLTTAVWLASPPGLRRALVGGTVVTLVPLGMFLLPSINPSSWAVLSAMTFTVALLGYITTEDRRRRILLGALSAVSLAIGCGARADVSIYTVLAVGLAVIMTWRSGAAHLRRLVYPVLLAVVAFVLFLSVGQSEAVSSATAPDPSFGSIARLFADIPSLWTGALGGWGLGWLDTSMPAIVWVSAWSVLVGVVFAALGGADRRQVLALVCIGGAVWVVPGYMQYISGHPVGAAIQPRYILPLIVMLAVIAIARVPGRRPVRWSGGQWVLVVVALSVANGAALYVNIRRYVTGIDVQQASLDRGREWWWDVPIGPNATWIIGSVAFGVALALLTSEMLRELPAEGSGPSTGADGADKVADVDGDVASRPMVDAGTGSRPLGDDTDAGSRPAEGASDDARPSDQVLSDPT